MKNTVSIESMIARIQLVIGNVSVNDGTGKAHGAIDGKAIPLVVSRWIDKGMSESDIIEITQGMELFMTTSGHALKVKQSRDGLTQSVKIDESNSKAIAYNLFLMEISAIKAEKSHEKRMNEALANFSAMRIAAKRSKAEKTA